MSGADLRHVDTWLFDLDNTLYPMDSGLGAQLSPRMTAFVARTTGLSGPEALKLQKRYLADYGLTLRGMMLHHDVDPDVFHAIFHDAPLDCLIPDPALAAALAWLPGRRLIFTNADAVHTERVLNHLALAGLFEAVFHIGSAAFHPKPSDQSFQAIIAAHAIVPERTAFFEDSARNLEPAARLGMTTVLVGPHAEADAAPFIDYRVSSLAPFLAQAQLKETV
jgi:putative hydrolase of the HAD superfamily